MASTHKLLLFSKVSSNLVVLIHGVNPLTLMLVSVHLNYLYLIIMYKWRRASFSSTAIHHFLQMSTKCAIKTLGTFGLATGVLHDYSHRDM